MLIIRTVQKADINLNLIIEQIMLLDKVEYLQRYDHGSGVLELKVLDTWLAADDSLLDNIISTHDKDEETAHEIDDFVPEGLGKPIQAINYKSELTKSLFPERTFDNGLLISVKYYRTRDEGTGALSDQVLQVDVNYILKEDAVHKSAKTVESRETKRTWNFKGGALDPKTEKISNKFYPHITESRAEGRKRRDNIFNIASKDIVVLLMFTQTAGDQEAAEFLGIAIAGAYETEFTNFTKIAAAQPLIDAITNDSGFAWLDNLVPTNPTVQYLVPNALIGESIREYIVRSFSGIL